VTILTTISERKRWAFFCFSCKVRVPPREHRTGNEFTITEMVKNMAPSLSRS